MIKKSKPPKDICQMPADKDGTECRELVRWRIILPWDEAIVCSKHLTLALGEMINYTSDGKVVVEYYND